MPSASAAGIAPKTGQPFFPHQPTDAVWLEHPERISGEGKGQSPMVRDSAMSTMTIEEAQAKLSEVIDKLAPGEEVIITRNAQPVAKLVGQQRPSRKPRRPGSAKGKLVILAEDDEHLQDFQVLSRPI
jgi:prevent-host-death family protein